MGVHIDVRIDERGPASLRLCQADRLGHVVELERHDPYVLECERDAFERLLDAGRRLPAGTIEVVVGADEFRGYPASEAVGRAIATRAP